MVAIDLERHVGAVPQAAKAHDVTARGDLQPDSDILDRLDLVEPIQTIAIEIHQMKDTPLGLIEESRFYGGRSTDLDRQRMAADILHGVGQQLLRMV